MGTPQAYPRGTLRMLPRRERGWGSFSAAVKIWRSGSPYNYFVSLAEV